MTRDTSDLVATLQQVEERLRELVYECLREAAEDGDQDAVAEERRLQQARRAVERALRALGQAPED
ncbi:MAG: hypothetical protein FJW86_10675 [Actinobacteria bacterium]|nr:hypothetical protein [Actinomycetota bacterium]